jgi:GINS complex subunit 4
MSFDDLERDLGISYSYQDEEEEQEQKNGMQILVKVLVNERRAPELLQYDQELVDSVKRKIKEQQDLVDQLSANESSKIAADLMQLEIDRIQYVLTSYLRTRLLKIQRFVMHVLTNEAVLERLSPAEFAFASKYVDVVAENFTLGFLQNIPERFRALDDDSIQPSMGKPREFLNAFF